MNRFFLRTTQQEGMGEVGRWTVVVYPAWGLTWSNPTAGPVTPGTSSWADDLHKQHGHQASRPPSTSLAGNSPAPSRRHQLWCAGSQWPDEGLEPRDVLDHTHAWCRWTFLPEHRPGWAPREHWPYANSILLPAPRGFWLCPTHSRSGKQRRWELPSLLPPHFTFCAPILSAPLVW